MKVLVIGSGGREHALVWKLSQSVKITQIYCAPGNAGIASYARCVPLAATDLEGLLHFALKEGIDLTVVGPEAPLVEGIVDFFQQAGLKIFGPTARAAEIEGSKAFAKKLMTKYGVPTAAYQVFTEAEAARVYIRRLGTPCVIKADGLAGGKGVIIASEMGEALNAVDELMDGKAGRMLVVEEFLAGEEVSVMAFADGKTVKTLAWAQDHKRAYDGDQGPNTGGMGAYSPTGLETPLLEQQIAEEILSPVVRGLAQEGRPYQGLLYAGLILTSSGPKVLEFNARFGDPETQAVLIRLETDLVDIMEAVISGKLKEKNIRWSTETAVCIVLASGGYPRDYETGYPILGLRQVPESVMVFHAGTEFKDGAIVTKGGRVLGVTGRGISLERALENAYSGVEGIRFSKMHCRVDIGWRALQREKSRLI